MLTVYSEDGGYDEAVLENAAGTAVTSEINGEYALEFNLPLDDEKIKFIEENKTVIRRTETNQLYRVKKTSEVKSANPGFAVRCEHVFFDSKNVFIAGFEHQNGVSANELFKDIWTNARGFSLFNDSEVSAMGMKPVSTLTDFEDKNKTNPWELTNNLIDLIGQGEVYIDNKAAAFVEEIGALYPVLRLDLAANMDSITVEKDTSGLITRLYAFGKNNLDLTSYQGEAYIDSPHIGEYGIIEGYMDFSDISDSELLYARAAWQFDSDNPNRIDEPYITISGKFIDMSPIYEGIDRPHLGQKVKVEGYDGLRIIKIIERPDEPYNTEITIGQIKKDLFYFFKRFNDTSYRVSSGKVDVSASPAVVTEIVEVTKQEVVAADVIEATAAFIDDLQIERLETNFKGYIVLPNLTVTDGKAAWTDEGHTWRGKDGYKNSNIRGYMKAAGMEMQFIEAHLIVPGNADKMTAAEVTPAVINGRQLYFTSVTGAQAFEYLTFTAPKTKYTNMSDEEAAMYVVYKRRPEAEYVKKTDEFIWESDGAGGGTYNVRSVYGVGDQNGRGQYMFEKDSDGGRLVYVSRTDGKKYGVSIDDEGLKARVGNVDCLILYGKVYESYADAESDRQNLPLNALVFTKGV